MHVLGRDDFLGGADGEEEEEEEQRKGGQVDRRVIVYTLVASAVTGSCAGQLGQFFLRCDGLKLLPKVIEVIQIMTSSLLCDR